MANRKSLIEHDGEVRELTAEDFKHFVPFSALPQKEQKVLTSRKKARGLQKSSAKEVVTIRLSLDVVEQLRANGPGWQTRVDTVLRQWIEKQPKRRQA